jgi:hypothetical protein
MVAMGAWSSNMRAPRSLVLFALPVVALAACKGGDRQDEASAANKAEDGQISINASGVEMRIPIPEGLRRGNGPHDNDGLIYPGSTIGGMHIESGQPATSGQNGEVELRFASPDAPALVARWYHDPARAREFTLVSAGRDGDAFTFEGRKRDGNGRFRLRLSPAGDGGTDGRLLLGGGG